ncbi:Tetratricopeptide repeat protein 39B-like protein [Dinothrombium tinctorium]|uniref:Tetratricopeptide repeat protein 39B-like protein n=1 Tax=Dinothrombium tinctorium TaxID=1965070 RepID=A0A443QJC6_9ACAR|nr:Tetratricopeptide repeat protein 39B-like protein [Dinothrombium tinctorium]
MSDNKMTLLELLDDTVQHTPLFLNNEYEKCREKFALLKESSMYHHFGWCLIYYVESILTMNKEIMKIALEEIEKLLNIYNKKYRKHCGIFSHRNFDNYSDEEVHAELSYSILLSSSALLGALYDPSFSGFIKGAYRMTSGYMGLREGQHILNARKNWQHPRVKEHYEALLKFFLGLFEIVIAYMPAKLSRLLDFIGFSGRLENGIEFLESSFMIKNTYGSLVSGLVLIFIYMFSEYFYGLGDSKLEMIKKVEIDCLSIHPKSAYTAAVSVSIKLLEAKFDEVITLCEEQLSSNIEYPQYVQYIFYWFKSWSNAYQCKWKEAANGMRGLLGCKWSPALFNYIYGSFLFMEMNKSEDFQCDDDLRELFEKIPTLRQKIGGRKVFHDNFVVSRSQKCIKGSSRFFLPTYELFYIWNYFAIVSKQAKSLDTIFGDIKSRLASGEDEFESYDDYANLLFLKAVVLKHRNQENDAKALFFQIMKQEKKLKNDYFLLAHCAFEIGLIHFKNEEYFEAKSWLNKSKKNFSGYLTECLLHFRADIVLNRIRSIEKATKENVEQRISNCSEC